MNDNLRQQAEELGGKTVQSDQPEEQAGQMVVETHLSDPCIVFFELRKKFPGSEDWGVLHVTVRDMQDDLAASRVAWWVKQMTGQEVGGDWQLADTPKYGGGYGKGGGGNSNKPKRVPVPDDGWFKVTSVRRSVVAEGKRNAGKSFITVRGEAPEGNYYEAGGGWEEIIDNSAGFAENWRESLPQDQWKESHSTSNELWVETTKRVGDNGMTFYNIKGFQLRKKAQ